MYRLIRRVDVNKLFPGITSEIGTGNQAHAHVAASKTTTSVRVLLCTVPGYRNGLARNKILW